ncbi:hypothetical protein BYT27DRAFT_7033103, partial [Phlegmacium glaucopus]
MPRITEDPNLELPPDFNSPAFLLIFNILVSALNPLEAVIQQFNNAWTLDHDTRVAAWVAQQEEDVVADGQARQERDAEELAQQVLIQKQAEADTLEKEKKKPKLKDFVPNKLVKNVVIPRTSAFALNKLKALEYVELYYFTAEGCDKALQHERSIPSEVFTFTQHEDQMLLRPMAAYKPSSKALQDEELTWKQMSIAKTSLLQHMMKEGW